MINTPDAMQQLQPDQQHPTRTLLERVPTLAILEWIDVPVLALAEDGSIVFSNWAFADMIGYTPDMVLVMTYSEIFGPRPKDVSAIDAVAADADLVIPLAHLDGSVVQAKISEAFLVGDAEIAVLTFDDMTEQFWLWDQ